MDILDIGIMTFIKTTYPVSFIIIVLAAFGATLRGFAGKSRLKKQDKLIDSLESEVERLTK